MARVMFLTLLFSPDGNSTAQIMTELALGLKDKGHQVTVVTATPHYNLDEEQRRRQPLRKCYGGLLYKSEIDGLEVLHVPVRKKGSRILSRVLDHLGFHLLSTVFGLTIAGKQDVIFAPTPPLTIGLNAWLLGILKRVPFVYNVQEIFPDIVKDLDILQDGWLYRLLEKIEKFTYNRAVKTAVISEWFKRALIAKGVRPEKVVVIPNFVDTEFVTPLDKDNEFSRRHGINEKFVVMFAGNIGLSQGFETILEAARKLAHVPEILFLFVGDGARREWLEQQLKDKRLENVKLLPYQPRSSVPLIYASSDLCLVPLKKGIAGTTFPSKIYTIMAAGRPALVSADEDSELGWVVQEADCGFLIEPEDSGQMAQAIEKAYSDRSDLKAKGMSGRRYVEEHHSTKAVVGQYSDLFNNISSRG